MHIRLLCTVAALGIAALASHQAIATPVTFTGSSGSLAASASFTVVGSNLQIVLSNTSSADATIPPDVLTGVFFNIAGNPSFTAVSATSGGNSYTLNIPNAPTLVSGPGTDIGGAWAFASGLSVRGASYGIGAAGYGIFGSPNVFPGPNVDGDPGVDGVDYGLLPPGDDLTTGNGGIDGRTFTVGSTVFQLSLGGLSNFDPSSAISGLTFQYGTSLTEPSFPGTPGRNTVPEPGSLALIAVALTSLATLRRMRT